MQRSGAPSVWMEIELHRDGSEVRVSARGSRGEHSAPHLLGSDATAEQLSSFASGVREAAARRRPLGTRLAEAQAIHRAVLREGKGELKATLTQAAGGPLLVRLRLHGADLQAVQWHRRPYRPQRP